MSDEDRENPPEGIDWEQFRDRPRPFYGLKPASWALYRSTALACYAFHAMAFRTRTRGLENVPKDGPLLLLANHTALLDPFWVALYIWRPSRFMAATSVFKMPVLGPYMAALGAFPKMKYVKDKESMATLARHYEDGQAITLFPEGVRTWTGEPGEILPGIGRLIKRLDARVLYGRIRSGHLIMPRWARYPRYVPLDLDYVGPVEYGPEWSVEAITADVREHLHVLPRRDRTRFAWGTRLAAGLEKLMWACPVCGTQDQMVVPPRDQDRIHCRGCGATWRLDLDTVMNGEGGAPTFTVAEAHRRMLAGLGDPPVLDRPRFEAEGVVGRSADVAVYEVHKKGKPAPVARGPMQVTADEIRIGPDPASPAWHTDFARVLSVSTEVADQLFVRRADGTPTGQLFRFDVHGESPLKWGHVLQAWQRRHSPIT